MSQPSLPERGTITIICACGIKKETGREDILRGKFPKKCKECGLECLIRFEPFDPDADVDAT